jgi:hypothetical protein
MTWSNVLLEKLSVAQPMKNLPFLSSNFKVYCLVYESSQLDHILNHATHSLSSHPMKMAVIWIVASCSLVECF